MARPTLPTETKKRRGTLQPCRTNFNEPVYDDLAVMPTPPEHLSALAKELWLSLCPILSGSGVLKTAHVFSLECLCEAFADGRYARIALQERGATTYQSFGEGGSTMWRAYPEIALIADADRRFKSWCASFGITPADASKVIASPAKAKNKFTALAEQAKAFSSRPN